MTPSSPIWSTTSRDSNSAPRRLSSAFRLCGGTRPSDRRVGRSRPESREWSVICHLPCINGPVERKSQQPVSWLCGACGRASAFEEQHSPGHGPRGAEPGLWRTLWTASRERLGRLLADDLDRDRELDV